MMRSKNLIVVALLLSFVACSKKDVAPQQVEKIFILAVDPALNTLNTANWLFIHDVNGQLLFYKTFEGGDTVTFNTSAKIPDEKISVTLMEYTSAVTYKLTSYLQISPGEVWTLQAPKFSNYVPPDGSVQFTLQGVPSDFLCSDMNGTVSDFNAGSYTAKLNHYPTSTSYLITTRDIHDTLRYIFVDDVKPNSSYSISYSDMKVPETILPVSFSAYSVSARVFGSEGSSPTGYFVQNFLSEYNTSRTSIKIGFPSRLTYFKTNLEIVVPQFKYDNVQYDVYGYYKQGNKPTSIDFSSDNKFEIQNRLLKTFSFTAGSSFVQRVSTWNYDNQALSQNQRVTIEWTVHSPEGNSQKLGTFPPGFLNIYPELKLMDTTIGGYTIFYLSGAMTYEELIGSTFKGQTISPEKEYYYISVQ